MGGWRRIIPGETTAQQALCILGIPDEEDTRDDYQILRYINHQEWGWQIVEIWSSRDSNGKVVGIFLKDSFLTSETGTSLNTLVSQFGRPNKVTWSMIPLMRFLIWSDEGIAVLADANITDYSRGEFEVVYILYFEPMELETFLQNAHELPWPYIGSFSEVNLFTFQTTDAPDILPEDPYDWERIPTPSP